MTCSSEGGNLIDLIPLIYIVHRYKCSGCNASAPRFGRSGSL